MRRFFPPQAVYSFRRVKRGGRKVNLKAEYISREAWLALLPSLRPENARAIAVSLETGLRIDDVLKIRVRHLVDDEERGQGILYRAKKTGKEGFARCSKHLIDLLRMTADEQGICFPAVGGGKSAYRSRQAVWKDLRRAAKNAGIKPHISPHSARKTFAVELYHKQGIDAVQAALQHGDRNTTNLYALADLQGATYDRAAMIEEITEKVITALAERLGVDLSPVEHKDFVEYGFSGEDDLQ